MSTLQQWSDELWIVAMPLRFYGLPFGTRMTVLRLRDGSLLLHSPRHISAALQSGLAALGPVRHVLAPNKLHHLFLGAAHSLYECRPTGSSAFATTPHGAPASRSSWPGTSIA